MKPVRDLGFGVAVLGILVASLIAILVVIVGVSLTVESVPNDALETMK